MQLFVNTPGTAINQKDFCFRLSHKDKFFDVSPEKVESIVATNKAVISTQAIVLALENNIDILFLDSFGDPVGRVWFAKMGSTALIRRRQLEAEKNTIGMTLGLDVVAEKLKNQIRFLKKLMYSRPGKEDHFNHAISSVVKTNFLIPDYLGVGKSVSRGFGCLKKLI